MLFYVHRYFINIYLIKSKTSSSGLYLKYIFFRYHVTVWVVDPTALLEVHVMDYLKVVVSIMKKVCVTNRLKGVVYLWWWDHMKSLNQQSLQQQLYLWLQYQAHAYTKKLLWNRLFFPSLCAVQLKKPTPAIIIIIVM